MRILILLAVLWSSCRASKTPETVQKEKDEILFLVLRISKDSVQKKNVIELVSQKKVEGTIKDNDQSSGEYENYMTIEYFRQNKLAKIIVLEHPLFKRMEYPENNVLISKSLDLHREEFFIRLQIKGISNQVRISETLKGNNRRELITLDL